MRHSRTEQLNPNTDFESGEIAQAIEELRKDEATGTDEIHADMVKEGQLFILVELEMIYNGCMKVGASQTSGRGASLLSSRKQGTGTSPSPVLIGV